MRTKQASRKEGEVDEPRRHTNRTAKDYLSITTPCTGNKHRRRSANEISWLQTAELHVLRTPYQWGLEHVNLSNITNVAEHDNN